MAMVLARFYPVLGGTEKQALLLAQYLRKQGTELFVVTARRQQQKAYEELGNIKIYRTASYFSGWSGSLIFMFSSFIFLWRKHRHFDIIHVFLAGSPALMAVLLGRLLQKKVVLKFGGAGSTGDIATSNKSLLGRIKISLLKKYISSYVVPTQEISAEIRQEGFYPAKTQHIANGVDIEKFSPVSAAEKTLLRQELKLPLQHLVLYAGRLEKGKGVDILLTCWSAVCQQFPTAHLLILGDGTLLASLKNRAMSLDCREQIHFLGTIQEIHKYLQTADLFVLPSLAEGLSNALLEAASCRLAIIATDIGGTNELIGNGRNGLLVTLGNSQILAERIVFLLTDEQERSRLGTAARQTVAANYSIGIIADKYLNLYKSLIERTSLDTHN
ncbi:MAG: glycosyltransferase family 4 protein [Elusimicrobia bacterium]|nr:glycosyltransferase family 4 protein [Elusimicrobiota bacterium]